MGLINWLTNHNTKMSPSNPQTGDGKTKRDVYDKPRVTFRNPDGSKTKPNKKK